MVAMQKTTHPTVAGWEQYPTYKQLTLPRVHPRFIANSVVSVSFTYCLIFLLPYIQCMKGFGVQGFGSGGPRRLGTNPLL